MESKDKSPPVGSPVGSPKSPIAAPKSPIASPKSPVTSPKSPAALPKSPVGSPERAPSPTSGAPELLPETYWTDAPQTDDEDGLEDVASSTASISSSVLHYRTVNGRTYHSTRGNAEYWNANDDRQNDALDLVHHALTLTLDGKLFLAPVKDDVQKVVDIGTGTGSWAIDFADAYPDCEVIGTDVSPIQPSWIPPNLKFEIDDCTLPWTFDPDSIDFVHIRYMIGSIQNWHTLYKEAYRCIKPGGWIQHFESNGRYDIEESSTSTDYTALQQFCAFFAEGGRKLNQSFSIVDEDVQKQGMTEAGFVDIQVQDIKIPAGTWAKDPQMKQIGACVYRALYDDPEGYMTYMAPLLGWSKEAVMVLAAHMRRELRDQGLHKYFTMRMVYGRKPE